MTQTDPSSGGRAGGRTVLIAAIVVVLAAAAGALGYYAWQDQGDELATAASEQAAESDAATSDLMKPGPLPENVLGSADAPVTIVEYSSMTCPHCAHFHTEILPALKAKYIDTGKAKYIIREFPLDNLAAAAAMLARCVDHDRYFPFVDVLYKTQPQWATGESDAADRLFDVVKQAGLNRASFDKCLSDQKLLDNIMAVRKRGADTFKVSSTPTFFVNGKLLTGAQSVGEFEKLMPPEVVDKSS